MTFAEKLRTLRTLRGLKQQELADLTGIPTNYLSLMESGKVIPAGEWDTRIREALGWSAETDAKLDDMKDSV